jgi:hypothetical protein
MEIIIKDQLLSNLLGKYLISKHQHVFILKHPASTYLLECLHDWSAALNKSNSVDTSYIDFRRQFDIFCLLNCCINRNVTVYVVGCSVGFLHLLLGVFSA